MPPPPSCTAPEPYNNMNTSLKTGILITVGFFFASFSYYFYQILFTPNLLVGMGDRMLYIHSNAKYMDVADTLKDGGYLVDPLSFSFLAKLTGYQDKVKPGAYRIKANSTNLQVIRMLKNGKQDPVKLTFNNIRLKTDLITLLSKKLEIREPDLEAILNNPDSCAAYGFNPVTVVCMFIPNTYELFWNTSAHALVKRMDREYKKFWTPARLEKAKAIGLSPVQVTVLASITEAETKKADEMPRVAGVYLNRLNRNMQLQADPTVVFAVGDFSIKRVREGHKATDSPYNTYKYLGLPPGPINLPSITALDAALNPEKHDFLFFCAREDFSGYHNFSADFKQHMNNARIYQKALDAANIQ